MHSSRAPATLFPAAQRAASPIEFKRQDSNDLQLQVGCLAWACWGSCV